MNPFEFSGRRIARPVLGTIIIATSLIYLLQFIPGIGPFLGSVLALKPSLVLNGEVWRLIGYALLHDINSPFHLFFNMLTLWMFGLELEELWGSRKFALFYVGATFISGIISLGMIFLGDPLIIGASGAVLAILTAYAMLFPDRQILLFFVIPVPVRIAVVIFGVVSIAGTIGGIGNVAHLTHLGGILAGFLILKSFPLAERLSLKFSVASATMEMRRRSAEKSDRDRLWGETIDPLLEKISANGIESLTKAERRILEKASALKSGGGKIIKGRFGNY